MRLVSINNYLNLHFVLFAGFTGTPSVVALARLRFVVFVDIFYYTFTIIKLIDGAINKKVKYTKKIKT